MSAKVAVPSETLSGYTVVQSVPSVLYWIPTASGLPFEMLAVKPLNLFANAFPSAGANAGVSGSLLVTVNVATAWRSSSSVTVSVNVPENGTASLSYFSTSADEVKSTFAKRTPSILLGHLIPTERNASTTASSRLSDAVRSTLAGTPRAERYSDSMPSTQLLMPPLATMSACARAAPSASMKEYELFSSNPLRVIAGGSFGAASAGMVSSFSTSSIESSTLTVTTFRLPDPRSSSTWKVMKSFGLHSTGAAG